MERGAILHCRPVGALDLVAIGLVDGDDIGKLQQAALDALQLVAGARDGDNDKHVDHIGDCGLRLPHADRLDQDHVVARGFGERHGLPRGLGDTAKTVAGRRGTDEGTRFGGEPPHPGLVAKDRPAGSRRRWIDGENGDLVALADQVQSKLIDEGRFTGAGDAGDADSDGIAGEGQEAIEQRFSAGLILGLRAFDKGDGTR